jgi:hypothetical protein
MALFWKAKARGLLAGAGLTLAIANNGHRATSCMRTALIPNLSEKVRVDRRHSDLDRVGSCMALRSFERGRSGPIAAPTLA